MADFGTISNNFQTFPASVFVFSGNSDTTNKNFLIFGRFRAVFRLSSGLVVLGYLLRV